MLLVGILFFHGLSEKITVQLSVEKNNLFNKAHRYLPIPSRLISSSSVDSGSGAQLRTYTDC